MAGGEGDYILRLLIFICGGVAFLARACVCIQAMRNVDGAAIFFFFFASERSVFPFEECSRNIFREWTSMRPSDMYFNSCAGEREPASRESVVSFDCTRL